MKKIWMFMIMLLCTGVLVAMTNLVIGHRTIAVQREVSQEVIRFHVRANSDEDVDQQLKLKVKDAIVAYLQPLMKNIATVRQAKEKLLSQIYDIEKVAEQTMQENDVDYEVSVNLKEEYFPEKCYGDYTFPAGIYDAVVVSLGKGAGKNWWCMLYPGLCFLNETYAVVTEESGEKLENVLSEDAFSWITSPKTRKWGFRWLDFA